MAVPQMAPEWNNTVGTIECLTVEFPSEGEENGDGDGGGDGGLSIPPGLGGMCIAALMVPILTLFVHTIVLRN